MLNSPKIICQIKDHYMFVYLDQSDDPLGWGQPACAKTWTDHYFVPNKCSQQRLPLLNSPKIISEPNQRPLHVCFPRAAWHFPKPGAASFCPNLKWTITSLGGCCLQPLTQDDTHPWNNATTPLWFACSACVAGGQSDAWVHVTTNSHQRQIFCKCGQQNRFS